MRFRRIANRSMVGVPPEIPTWGTMLADRGKKIAGPENRVVFVEQRAKDAQQRVFLPGCSSMPDFLISRDPSGLQPYRA